MFSQIEQIFSHIIRTRLTAFMLLLALPIAARAQEVTIVSSPTSIMEGKRATFIISVTPAPTSNLRVNIEVTGNTISTSYTRPTTITVGTSGTATLTVPTEDFTENPNDENWGDVSVRIIEGVGYTIGEQGSASVQVIDDEADENPPATVAPLPVVTLHTDQTRVAIGDRVTLTMKRTTPYDKRHRVDFRVAGHLPDITDWEPMVEILHPQSANRHPPGERSYSFRVQEETCGHTPGRKIEAYLFDAYYYGDNIPQAERTGDSAYKVGDPSSVTIDVYAPSNWQPTGAPTISGNLEVDQTLTVSHGLSGVTNIQWIRVQSNTETNIGTGNTYTIASADNDHRLKVKVTYNNGTCEIESALTAVVGGEMPVGTIDTNPPTILEGRSKTFRITMNPAPTAPLIAEVLISQVGDFITGSPDVGTHTVNFSTNQTTATITVNTEDDQVDEPNGEISAELLNSTGYDVGDPSIATVIVQDNDNPRMKIEAVTTPITEGDDAEFTIIADPVPATPLTVTVSVSENRNFITGSPGVGTHTVNFSANQATATLTVNTENDQVDELNGQIRAQLQSATDYDLGSPSSATVTVEDNDIPQLSIGADQTVAESAGSMEFTVTLDGPNAQTVTVDYATSDGTAEEPGDYTRRSGRLTFSPGDARTQTIRVTIRNDNIDEDSENFTLTLSNANNATIGGNEATGTITDDDTRGVTVEPTALNVPENGNNTYRVVLTSQPTENVTVSVDVPSGTDVSANKTSLTFTASNWRNAQTVRVDAADDTDSDLDPSVTITHTVSGGDYGANSVTADPVIVTIIENDISTLSIDNTSASESAGTMSFTVRLSVANTQAVTVNYATSNGTAIAPGDYTAVTNGTLTFPANSAASQTISVTIVNDDIDEENETFTITLSGPSSNAIIGDNEATGTIQDNDTRGVRVSPTSLTVNEGSSNTYTVVLNSEPTASVTVGVSKSSGSSEDVTVSVTSLTFPTNTWNIAQTVTVSADQDNDETNDAATVQHTVSGGDYGANNVTVASVRVTVDDDETPPLPPPPPPPTPSVSISANPTTITEGGTTTVTVTASTAPSNAINVNVNVSQNGNFITGSPPSSVTINANQTTTTFTINTVDDNTDESNGSITTQVQAGTGYTVGSPSSATVIVNDNDNPPPGTPQLTISAGTSPVTEGTNATFTITADPAPSTAITVSVNVTETEDVISGTPPSTVTIGTTGQATLTVATDDDNVDEDDSVITAQVQAGTGYTVGDPSSATITVSDNDSPGIKDQQPEVTISAGTSPVTEGTAATFTITADPAPTTALKVRVNVTQTGKVISGTPASSVTFKANQTTATLTVATNDDNVDEDDSAVTAQVQAGTGYTVGSPSSASVTVEDDDAPGVKAPEPPEVTIEADTSPVTEGTAATFTITANPAPTTSLNVMVDVSQTGNFISGSTGMRQVTISTSGTATLTVETDNDNTDESNGSITAQVKTGAGYTVGSPSSATVTVNDNDAAPRGPPLPKVTITANPTAITEGTDATFKITANPRPTTALKVRVNVTQTGKVFRGTPPSTVTFRANQTTATLRVATHDDNVDEIASQVTAQVQAGTGYTVGSPSSATATVNDNDIPQMTITANRASVTEGTDATFTITANPRPATALTVNVSVTQTGQVISGTLPSTVTFNANQTTATLRVATDDDDVRESAGTVTAQITTGVGYTVGTPSSVSVTVNDNDTPPNSPATGAPIIIGKPELGETLTTDVSNIRDANGLTKVSYNYQWIRVIGSMETEIPGATGSTYKVVIADSGYRLKVRVNFTDDVGYPEELESALTAMMVIPGVTPVITITADPPSITEGTDATFTITATPAPTITLTVNVNVTETANTLSGTPPSTVTISAGQATLTVATDDDKTDEHASVVIAQVQAGAGYTVGAPSSARVLVLDDDLPPAIDATLSSLTINPGVLTPTFAPETLDYTALVPNATSTATVTATPKNPDATVSINGRNTTSLDMPFTGDTMDITVTVTAVDNITQLTYTITVNRALSGLPQVTITANPKTVTEGTNATFTVTANQPAITDLTVKVNVTETAKMLSGTPPSTVTISAGQTTATLTVATQDDDIDEHASVLTAQVRTGTGYTIGDPSLASVLVLDDEVTISTDATLGSLTINPGVLTPTFDPETLDYTASVTNADSTITVTATGNNASATVSINGQNTTSLDVSLVEGTNTITIVVTAEDNTTQVTYTITVNREAPSTDATLSSLTINPGVLTPAFDPETLDYTASVANEDSTITVTAIANNPGATVSINGQNTTSLDVSLVEGTNIITVVVTAEDNTTQVTYTITITREAPVPQVTISAGTTPITEGTAATFTITATPAPTTELTVNVSVTQTGSVLSGTPPSTITISANGSTTTLTVATDDDNVDEEAGVITAALQAGTGYTVGTPSSASVTVNDNDAAPNNPATGAPTITGTPEVGETLTADVSNIRDTDGLENVTYIYQWIRVIGDIETEIANATGVTYEVAAADIGHQIKVRVNFNDDLGNAEELESALTSAVVAPVVPQVTISANATSITEGEAATFTITASPAPTTAITVNVNITQTGDVISGTPPATITINANQTTLTVATDDDNTDEEASAITAQVQAGTGYTVGDPSSATVTVNDNDLPPNSPATGAPTIIGTPQVGQTLTADVSNIQDANGLTNVSYTYQWIRLVGSVETEIIGATSVTYEVTITDTDRQLKVRVNFTDDLGYDEELESALTAIITPEEPRVVKLDGWLARFGRTASNHVIETVRERVRGHVGINHVVIGGYNLDQMNYDGLFYNPTWMTGESPMRFSIDAAQSAHDKEILKQIISSTSFALSGKMGPHSEPRWAVWGRGATTRFSGTDDDQTVEGDVTSVMLGIDYGDNSFQGGLVLSYTMGDGILGTVANTRDEWSVETTLTGIYPWARLALTNKFSVWGMLGYGGGDLPLSLEGIVKLETDANMVMGAIGTRTDLIGSTYHDGFSLSLASDAVLSRANADDLADLLENKGTASRVRVLLEGSHVLWVAGGSLQPLVELGMRYDGGDADTGMGIEFGAGIRYVLTSLGLMVEGRIRGLIAHQEGSYEEWGGSGTIRLSPNPSGEGLSLRVSPSWGEASGSARALWSRPDMSDIASGRNSEVFASNRVSAEVAYGVPILGDKLIATPFVGLQNRHKRLGIGLHKNSLFGLAVEGMQHNRDLALRVRAGMHTQHIILRLEGSLDTYGHHAYLRLHHDIK